MQHQALFPQKDKSIHISRMAFFSDPFIYISQNILYVSDLFTYTMIVKYMINKSLNHRIK